MLLYPLSYAVVWSLPTIVRIYQASSGQAAPWQVQTIDKACVVLQGVVDATIYGATESSLSSWRNLFFPSRFPVVNGFAPANVHSEEMGRKAPRRRDHDSANDHELVSRASTTDASESRAAIIDSNDSPGISRTRTTGVDSTSSDQLELTRLEGPRSGMSIRKTVEITVMGSTGGKKHQDAGVPRPPKLYFPGSRHVGSSKSRK
jgi:hypothetical protein